MNPSYLYGELNIQYMPRQALFLNMSPHLHQHPQEAKVSPRGISIPSGCGLTIIDRSQPNDRIISMPISLTALCSG